MNRSFLPNHYDLVAGTVALGILLPVFFQIRGGIFRDPSTVLSSGGLISAVPIPLSVAVCFLGIALIGGCRNTWPALPVVCTSIGLMILSSIIMIGDAWWTPKRFLIMVQFMIPMLALVLGQLYEKIDLKGRVLPRVFFGVLCVIVPVQLFCSWLQNHPQLSPYLYVFSIYQHLQYVPVVLSGASLIALFALGRDMKLRKWMFLFLPVMTLYVVASNAIVAMVLFGLGTVSYALLYGHLKKGAFIKVGAVGVVAMFLVLGYLHHYWDTSLMQLKFQVTQNNGEGRVTMPGLQNRLPYWKFYGIAWTKDTRSFLMGTAQVPDRNRYSSAHNYYLDFLYYFGLIAFVPLLVLFGGTVYGVCRERRKIRALPELSGIAIVVLFLLVIDNMLKVGLRQPYPGIFTFFLWGILLSKLWGFSRERALSKDEGKSC